MNLLQRVSNSIDHRIRYRTLKPILEKLEIQYGHLFIPELDDFEFNKLPKIALVKQDVYQDLYCCSFKSSPQEKVLSTLRRSGFVGLFTKYNADFLIVKTEEDPECNIWKQKHYDCNQESLEYYESLKEKYALYSQSVKEIDWSIYDVVISLDISIPAKITKKYPQVVWCYCIGEPCMSAYQESKKQPIEGYDLFLNQQFRQFPFFPSIANHEIEFPYYLQYYGCFDTIIEHKTLDSDKEGIFIEFNWRDILTNPQIESLAKFGKIEFSKGIKAILNQLGKSKYFVIGEGTRGLWGNAMIEAIASGCLVVGNPLYVKHKSLFTPDTVVYSFDELLTKLEFFENHPEIYQRELEKQRQILNYVSFERPLRDLFIKARNILKKRNIDTFLTIRLLAEVREEGRGKREE